MQCQGKALQIAALLFALACNGASAAAVHRAEGVDAITAKLIGQTVSSHVQPSGAEEPNSYFLPDSWQPVYRDLSARRTYEDSSSSSSHLVPETGRQQQYFPQPRAANLDASVASSTPSAPAAVVSEDGKKRGSPEVQDSIAAVASQLLNQRPTMVMDTRQPSASETPDKKWEKVVVTNSVPLKVSAQTDKPVTKVPPISEISTKDPATTTVKTASMPTRFPPRKPSPITPAPATTERMVEITTKKMNLGTAVVQPINMNKKPVMEILSTMRPTMATTAATPVIKKTTVVSDRKPVEVSTARTTTTVRRPAAPVPITILKKTNSSSLAQVMTTSRPKPMITESIPLATRITTPKPTVQKQAVKPSPAIFRLPSASVVTKAPEATRRTPPKFEILSTQKATTVMPTKIATTTRPTTTTTTTTTTTIAPETTTVKKSKKKPSKKPKKNKKRRRPSKPENKVGALEEKQEKPLTSRIYDYLSGDMIPSFGTTMVGLLMTAGLAGLMMLPLDGFSRRSDQFKREEEADGIFPSIIKAVYTSMNPPGADNSDMYADEQGPRMRVKRQYRFEGVQGPQPFDSFVPSSTPRYRRHPYPMYKQAGSTETHIMQVEASQQPFSVIRLLKQMVAVKLDVLSNALRMASEHLRNYAQNAENPKKPTTQSPAADKDESSTDSDFMGVTDLPQDATESILLKSPSSTTTQAPKTSETPVIKDVVEENEDDNLVRRRTTD